MSSGLTILTPGGLAMASEEVFALMDQCRVMASVCEAAAWRLLMVAHMASGVGVSVAALQRAEDEFDALATSLHQLAAQAAEQEARRTTTLHSLRDRFLYTAVAGAAWSGAGKGEAWTASMTGTSEGAWIPRSHLRGGEDGAVMDDAAAILAGHEAPVAQVSVSVASVAGAITPARSMAERIARIPDTKNPIRVETYRLANGDTHAEVFIAGTHGWGVGSSQTPFDLESNLRLVAGQTALSVVATTQALRQAGVKPGDSVMFVGHSQGGAVATTLAESGVYKTAGLVTAGSPTGTLPTRGDYPAVVIEHTNDIVPGLGGARLTTKATVVTRDSGHNRLDVLGAHSTESYEHTAALIDQSVTPELAAMPRPVLARDRGRAMVFSATRQPGPQRLG
jgi:hypothetical protein